MSDKIRILIIDDDRITGGLTRDLLREAGFDATHLAEGSKTMEALKQEKFPVVVLDILMPGIDGMTLLHQIKNDPSLKETKVIMVSGKSFPSDKKQARDLGADLFIEKPFKMENFAQQINDLFPRPGSRETPVPKLVSAGNPAMAIKIWGGRSRGADAASRYGSRTPCVTVNAGDKLLVFDAGSGAVALGEKLAREGRHKAVWLFLTHFHPDHIEGLGSLVSSLNEDVTLNIAGAGEPDKGFQKLVEEALEQTLPEGKTLRAAVKLYEMQEKQYEAIPGMVIASFYVNHPGRTIGFGVDLAGRRLIYCPDSELYSEPASSLQDYDEKLGALCSRADLLIHDGRYTHEDYSLLKGQGHSSFVNAVDFACRNQVKRLMLFHLDGRYDDSRLDLMAAQAAALAAERGGELQCVLVRDDLSVGI
ncbi:MAG: response regulator [Elusimicrobia bacterium]|nr:response regulator [Elusimicrobiota bacterium]